MMTVEILSRIEMHDPHRLSTFYRLSENRAITERDVSKFESREYLYYTGFMYSLMTMVWYMHD